MRASRIIVALVSLVVISTATPAMAGGSCNNATLRGSYAFRVDGSGGPTSLFPGPFAAAGKNTYDGKGGMQGEIVVSANGAMISAPYTGSYLVDGSCTGTKTATLPNGLTVEFYFVIDSNGRGIQMIVTAMGGAGGYTISGDARKLFPGAKD